MSKVKALRKFSKNSGSKSKKTGVHELSKPALQNLPTLEERLREFSPKLLAASATIKKLSSSQIYISVWEEIYAEAHKLKGLAKILSCPLSFADWISEFCEIILRALNGNSEISNFGVAAAQLEKIAKLLQAKKIDLRTLQNTMRLIVKAYKLGADHTERMSVLPARPYMDAFVSKKAFLAKNFKLQQWLVEDSISLDQI